LHFALGHDFRPEYRQMRRIKELIPGASVHAYTATATEQVRRDIADQLALKNPEFLVALRPAQPQLPRVATP